MRWKLLAVGSDPAVATACTGTPGVRGKYRPDSLGVAAPRRGAPGVSGKLRRVSSPGVTIGSEAMSSYTPRVS